MGRSAHRCKLIFLCLHNFIRNLIECFSPIHRGYLCVCICAFYVDASIAVAAVAAAAADAYSMETTKRMKCRAYNSFAVYISLPVDGLFVWQIIQ